MASGHPSLNASLTKLPLAQEALLLTYILMLAANCVPTRRQLLSESFIGPLPQQLQEAGNQFCAVLPLSLRCNPPVRSNISGCSELSIVPVNGSVCFWCGKASIVAVPTGILASPPQVMQVDQAVNGSI